MNRKKLKEKCCNIIAFLPLFFPNYDIISQNDFDKSQMFYSNHK